MDRRKLKGLYIGKGYDLRSLAKAMGISQPTLITKTKEDTLTVRDIIRMRELLDMTDDQILDIFFPRA